jgi:triphosphatase
MHEIELKFQVPAERRDAVRRALATRTAVHEALQATYFDTPDRALAQRRVAVRIRREGRRWVQTAKAAGDDLLGRLEHEVDLGTARPPTDTVPDLGLHAPHPALQAALAAAVAAGTGPLQPLYVTDIRRIRRVVRHLGARIELAYDEGSITAGTASLPVSEVEFELLDGPRTSLLDLAAQWAARHGLRLDPRSKAERGDRLARGIAQGPAVRHRAPQGPDAGRTPAQALAAGVQAALAQALGNAAELAEASQPQPQHVHQLRVALRRLRTLLAVYGRAWSPEVADVASLGAAAAASFRALGAARDDDVLADLLAGPLREAGFDGATQRLEDTASVTAVVRAPAFTAFTLAVLAAVVRALPSASEPMAAPSGGARAHDGPGSPTDLREFIARALQRLWKSFDREAGVFETLEPERQHRVRKQAKQLRYALEYAQSLFPAKRTARFLAALAEAQEALGAYTDILTGEERLRRRDVADPAVAFARGWLAGRREPALQACRKPLRRLRRTEPPWR